jgi:hypothetical protein
VAASHDVDLLPPCNAFLVCANIGAWLSLTRQSSELAQIATRKIDGCDDTQHAVSIRLQAL